MAITQTVEVPPDRRITLEVPHEVPTGPVVLTFSQTKGEKKPRMTEAEEKEWINDNIEWLNEEAMVNLSFQSEIGMDEGLKHDSAVYCDELISIPKSMITNYVGRLSDSKMEEVNAALRIALAVG